MFNGSFLRACMKLRIVQKIRFSLLESGRTKPWCPGLVSRQSVLYFELSFLGCGFLIHLSNRSNSPRFRALWKKIHQKYGTRWNRLYSRAIHCPASMEMHYVQWFLLKSVYEITVCEKIRFSLHESGWTKPWCLGLVSWPSAKA